MQTAGLVIVALAALGITALGSLYLLHPRSVAATFGLPVLPGEDATPWLRLKGLRDVSNGLVAGVLLLTASPEVIGWVLLATTVIPIGDAVTVLRAGSRGPAAWGPHVGTAVVMLIGVALLLFGG